MNTCSMCALNDLNTYPMFGFQAYIWGLSAYFVIIQDFFDGKKHWI